MKVLLIEPFYRNKYPPLGLMKISAYHKSLGHEVTFIKEKLQDYLKKEKTKACLLKIRQQLFKLEDRNGLEDSIIEFMKKPSKIGLDKVLSLVPKDSVFTTENILQYYRRDYYYEKLWDRVYITSLFTFNFIETLDAVELAKKLVKKNGTIYLGGISVSLNPEIYAERTGLEIGKNIITGLLDKPGIFDENDIIVDRLVPDYSILETIEYKYPQFTGYLTYATRGCTRCCDFCAVPKLEPVYKNYISVTSQIETIREKYGEQKDLILLDNNVLASNRFKEIIKDIKSLGFHRNAMYFEQNKLKFYYQYILAEKNTQNKDIFSEKLIKYLYWVANRRIKRKSENERFTQLLNEIHMGPKYQLSLEVLDHHYQEIYNLINNHLLKIGKHRYVDFNQGIDCRYITDEIMQLLSEIA
ncbi:MAG: hypothetical protein JW866_05565, partial [Ignavibacteriales bacterium]|nr:hypothetical protein [Ignavibacteriales bacterium]